MINFDAKFMLIINPEWLKLSNPSPLKPYAKTGAENPDASMISLAVSLTQRNIHDNLHGNG